MKVGIVRLLTTIRVYRPAGRTSGATAAISNQFQTPIRWRTSGSNDDTKKSPDEEENEFGVLRERVLDKVGDNLDQVMKFNAFQLFGIKQQYRVDTGKLQREMRQLQRLLHPDRFMEAKKASRVKSDYLSAAINDFYAILKNPYERGKYLLSLMSNKSAEDIERSLDELKLDDEFLGRMMDVREKISDRDCDTFELHKISSLLESEIESLITDLDRDFKSNNTDGMLKKLGQMKFLVKCHRSISERCDSFSVY